MKLFLGVLLAAAQAMAAVPGLGSVVKIDSGWIAGSGGAVPVSINHRLGIFGLLAHPAKESLRKKWIDFMSDFNAGLRSRAAAGASR